MNDYWQEAVETALKEEGLNATPDQVSNIAGSIEISAENYGMACGHDAIPSPVIAKESEAVKNLKSKIKQLEGDLEIYRTSVARRRNVDVSQVYLERYGVGKGNVIISSS